MTVNIVEELQKAIEYVGDVNWNTEFRVFPQTWASTALGFGGIGGQAITTANTIIICNGLTNVYTVFFRGRFAYKIENPNKTFYEDMRCEDMSGVAGAKKRYEMEQK